MRRQYTTSLLLLLLAVVLFATLPVTMAGPVIQETPLVGMDLGTSYLKVAAYRRYTEYEEKELGWSVRPASVEIVLNDQTNRKSPPCVALRYFPAGMSSSETKGKKEEEVVVVPNGYTLERVFAEQAQALLPRMPQYVVCSPTLLLRPSSAEERECDSVFIPFPKSKGGGNKNNNNNNEEVEGVRYTAEELVSMLLYYGALTAQKEDAERNRLFIEEVEKLLEDEANAAAAAAAKANSTKNHTTNSTRAPIAGHNTPSFTLPRRKHSTVKSIALAIPSRASLRFRHALLDSASLAGLRVERMAMSCTAAATQLGLLRGEELFAPTEDGASATTPIRYVLIYDMGSQLTEASLWEYRRGEKGSRGAASGGDGAHRIQLLSLVVDAELGGNSFDECIAKYWDTHHLGGTVLNASGGDADRLKQKVSLLRGAARAREMLSANKEATVVVEGVSTAQHTPFSTTLTREVFEKECATLFHRAVALRDRLLKEGATALAVKATTEGSAPTTTTPFTLANLSRFEVIGGGTRMPKLLAELSEGYKTPNTMVDRTLNSDEAAVMGVTYLGAASSRLLSRQSFHVKEWLPYSVGYYLQGQTLSEEEKEALKTVNNLPTDTSPIKILFPAKESALPDLKSIRLFHQTKDFEIGLVSPPEKFQLRPVLNTEKNVTSVEVLDHCDDGDCYEELFAVRGIAMATAKVQRIIQADDTDGKFVDKSKKKNKNNNKKTSAGGSDADHNSSTLEMTVMKERREVKLLSSEVVMEVALTDSGIPFIRKAFLQANLQKTFSSKEVLFVANDTTNNNNTTTTVTEEEKNETEDNNNDVNEDKEEDDSTENDKEKETKPVKKEKANSTNTTTAIEWIEVEEGEVKTVSGNHTVTIPLLVVPTPRTNRSSTAAAAVEDGKKNKDSLAVAKGRTLRRSKQIVDLLNHIDEQHFIQSSLRNDLESLLLSIKTLDLWYESGEEEWREKVRTISEWFDDEADQAGEEALRGKIEELKAVKKTIPSPEKKKE